MKFQRRGGFAVIVCMVLMAGCSGHAPDDVGDTDAEASADAGVSGVSRPVVSIVPAVRAPAIVPVADAISVTLPGRIVPTRVAELRARVSGIVTERLFEEGSEVKAGQVLFRIDSSRLQAVLAQAVGELARADAVVSQTRTLVDRYTPLVKEKAISAQDFDNAVFAHREAQANRQIAAAAVKAARIDLRYATVTAPISGRIGPALVTEGALVRQDDATLLARIQQLDAVYVDLAQSASDVARVRKAMVATQTTDAANHRDPTRRATLKVHVTRTDGGEGPSEAEGELLFSDSVVDPDTGQVLLRARLPNTGHRFLPGMFVRARIELGIDPEAIRVSQTAVLFGADGLPIVKVVDATGRVRARRVTLGAMQGAYWSIVSGLQGGEHVLTDAASQVADGATVRLIHE